MSDQTSLRRLGRVDLDLTTAGHGGAPLANLGAAVSDEQALELIAGAWEDGVRFFYTTPAYGNRLSELRFGQALQGRAREASVLSTKVGCRLTPGEPEPGPWARSRVQRMTFDYSYEAALREFEASLPHRQERAWPPNFIDASPTAQTTTGRRLERPHHRPLLLRPECRPVSSHATSSPSAP